MPVSGETKRETLNIRIKPEVRGLIDRPAELVGKTARTLCWMQHGMLRKMLCWSARCS